MAGASSDPLAIFINGVVMIFSKRDQCHVMPAGLEHAVHFAHSLTWIGKVLESELTEDNVEERICKG
jgi:hypothetical protein